MFSWLGSLVCALMDRELFGKENSLFWNGGAGIRTGGGGNVRLGRCGAPWCE